jgi:hypothetical protein
LWRQLLKLPPPPLLLLLLHTAPEVVRPALEAQQLRMLALLAVQLLPVMHSLPGRLVHGCTSVAAEAQHSKVMSG